MLENLRILDPESGYFNNGVIVIDNGLIKDFGSKGSIEIPKNANIIDCEGNTVMPGLIDAHLHVTGQRSGKIEERLTTPIGVFFARAVKDLENLVNAGFTTVVDAGSLIALHLRDAVNENTITGPRIIASGLPLSMTFGHADEHYMPIEYVDYRTSKKLTPFMSLICDGEDECRKATRYAMREGADFIKVMATGGVLSQRDRPEHRQFTLNELKAIVDEAQAANRWVHAHAQGTEGILNSLRAGVKVIAHAIYIDELASEEAKTRNAVVVPTLSIVQRLLDEGEKLGVPEWGLRKSAEVYEQHINAIKLAYKHGVKLATGTDFDGGIGRMGTNAMELKLFVEKIGMQPLEAIRAATMNAASAAGLEGKVGVIKKGAIADLIVVKGDPLNDINTLLNPNNIKLVFKEGNLIKKS
ncbi:amidohydrolase, imidazolonepropionase [Caldisphaera lagunensis DSM 15908]|uniref:Amidohydrolase, imidazolonepropionase n=1 Tax=Caldisphaera lagunensis (strain DSM 15908 / JCM 11604 / ANMR 0165 / IC-154) TaxID=1056495 RepID=L0AAR2_CALLD|nr:amidohydrolase family protein [Caldisphaera lagunensis]AFZ70514.1 amidohydrolase, imidazolonepropionase [Caldisphaera lagunensis DSM 15908]